MHLQKAPDNAGAFGLVPEGLSIRDDWTAEAIIDTDAQDIVGEMRGVKVPQQWYGPAPEFR